MIQQENRPVTFLDEIGLFVRDRVPIKHVEIKGRNKALQPNQNWGTGGNYGTYYYIYC